MNEFVLRGARVLVDGAFRALDVAVSGGKIAQIGEGLCGNVRQVRGFLIPGLIDEHIHGLHGCDTMQGTQAVLHMAQQLVRHGVTSFLPTTMNAGIAETRAAVEGVMAAMGQNTQGADIAGVHMEGPFLGEKYKGAQDAKANLLPTMENFANLTGKAGSIVRLMTLAPELPGACDFIREITKQGVVISAGHTDASYEEMQAAQAAGMTQVTHLFNGMNPLHHRAPGVPCAALTLDGLSPQMIADGVHLHPAVVKLAVRTGADLLLITDAMRAADMPDGVYELGGQTVYVKDRQARIAEGNLAGSTLTLDRAVRNVMQFAGLPLEKAVPMASERVAASLGLCDRGRIAPGLRADLALLDENCEVCMTFVAGELLFERA